MKQLKSILIISGLLVLFVGNIGVSVFKHICQENGTWTSYFVQTADDNCAAEKAAKHLKSCCSKEKENNKSDCCNDQTEYFKIKLDFFNDPSIAIPIAGAIIVPSSFVFVFHETQKEYYTANYINPPPIKAGKEILIQHQVFII